MVRKSLKKMRAGRSLPSRETRISVDWKKQILVVLALCAVQFVFAMDVQDNPKLMQAEQNKADNALMAAIERGSIKQVREAINLGANVNLNGGAPLLTAVMKTSNYHIVKILLASGADVNPQILELAENRGWYGGFLNTLLAQIPLSEQEKIRKRIPELREGSRAVLHGRPLPPHDIRKKISQILVDDMVQEQMHRLVKLVGSVKSLAYRSNQLNYEPESYKNLRKLVKNNIMRILYGTPKNERK